MKLRIPSDVWRGFIQYQRTRNNLLQAFNINEWIIKIQLFHECKSFIKFRNKFEAFLN